VIRVITLSRFYRNQFESYFYENKLRENGVRIESLTQAFSEDSGGQLAKRITKMFDEHHSVQTSIHVTRTMRFLAKSGYWPGGSVPYGYELEVVATFGEKRRKQLRVREDEAPTVRLVTNLFSTVTVEAAP
jgi:DNA invertase Pin-like site-specific DNA recombinase